MEDLDHPDELDNWDHVVGCQTSIFRRGSCGPLGTISEISSGPVDQDKPDPWLKRRHSMYNLDGRFFTSWISKKGQDEVSDLLSEERRTSSALDTAEDKGATMGPAGESERASESLVSKVSSFASGPTAGAVPQVGHHEQIDGPLEGRRRVSTGDLFARLKNYAPLVRIPSGELADTVSKTENNDLPSKLKETERDFRMINQISPNSW